MNKETRKNIILVVILWSVTILCGVMCFGFLILADSLDIKDVYKVILVICSFILAPFTTGLLSALLSFTKDDIIVTNKEKN
ncbi:MAG: hypothetical protein VZS44_12585 [Bacilli bacterium]|nr:hypothetical protein [Bacilli bacterium]